MSSTIKIALVIVVAAACGNKKADAPAAGSATGSSAGSGSPAAGSGAPPGSGSAAPIASAVCMPDTHKLSELVADDKTATVCAMPDPSGEDQRKKPLLFDDEIKQPQPTCMVVDLATGTWREAKAPPPPAKPAQAAFEVKQDAKGVRVCKGAVCTKLAVPPPKKKDDGAAEKYLAAVSDDGKRAVVVADSLKGAWLFDATTGKKVKELQLALASEVVFAGAVVFLGDLLYITAHGSFNDLDYGGTIYSWAGQPLGKTKDSSGAPLPLGGDLYAFSAKGSLEIVNTRTGKTSEVKASSILPLVRTSSGKLVGLSRELLVVIDPAAGKIEKQYAFPNCARKPAVVAVTPLEPSLVLFGDHALGRIGYELIEFANGGDGGQAAPAKVLDDKPGESRLVAGSGKTAYATTRVSFVCAQLRGHDTSWSQVVGDGPSVMDPSAGLTLVAADADGTFWATSSSALYKLTKQGRRTKRFADFPKDGDVVRSEPTRLLVLDLLGATKWHFPGAAPAVKAEIKERRLVAIDKTTGDTTELVRGQLGFVRAMGDEIWIVRDGTELLSIGEGATSAAPRGDLPEAATSVEIDVETVYFTPVAGDRVLAMPIAGGASTIVGDGLAAAEILGASTDRLFISADPKAQVHPAPESAPADGEMMGSMSWGVWAPPKRILSVPKAGGVGKVLANDLQTIRDSVSDPGHIYVQIAACYEDPENGCIHDNAAILVVDKRTNRARRMNGVGSCSASFVVRGRGVWLSTGERLDQRDAPAVFLGGGIPGAAVGVGDDLFLAIDHRVVRASSSGYEVIADVLADALAVGGSYLYFHDAEAALIGRIAIRTGKIETVVASAPAVGAMTADAGGVYWWDGITKSLEAASAPGAKRTLLANTSKPDGLTAGGGRVALRAGDRLTVVSAKDGASRIIKLGSAGDGVAGDDTYVYWTEEDAHANGAAVLLRAQWSGGNGQVISRVVR